jgi:transposase
MARRGRRAAPVELTQDERYELERYVRRRKTSQQLALRSRIVLLCADGLTNTEVAKRLRVTDHTVGKWRRRFLAERLDGLSDAPRSGMPRRISDEVVERLITTTLEANPKGATHWSTRSMAANMDLSHSTVGRIWRSFGLQPHRSETFQLSNDPDFIHKVRDVVGLYMSPPDNAVVLSFDEKSQIQALNRTQPLLPMRPGQLERRTPEYERNGTTTLFAALDVATGRVIGKCYPRHRAIEFRDFLNVIDKSVPLDLDVHVVLDNYATHKAPAIIRWLTRHHRFQLHFTPTHASWLNQVEALFSILTDKQLKRGVHTSVRELKKAVHEFLDAHNDAPMPFKWTKTADDILDNVARYCFRTQQAHGGE